MKRCPECNQEYSDGSLEFCLADGTVLTADDSAETIIIPVSLPQTRAQITFPLELFRVYCLFGYETDGGSNSKMWKDPLAFHRIVKEQGSEFLKTYNSWRRGKRRFTRAELLDGSWVKVGDHNYHQRLQMHDDGTLTEWPLFSFDESNCWGGEWRMIEGVLRLNIKGFELDVVADQNGFHSGVEDNGDERNCYFRVLHVR